MNRTENVELTVLCLIEDGDKILLQNRVKKDWQGYALPGGHVEPGESFVDAVVREMKEETGLTMYCGFLPASSSLAIKLLICAGFTSSMFRRENSLER